MTTKDNFMRMQSRKFGVDWRWRWAEILARNPDRLDWAYADDAVRRAAEFIQQRQSGNGSLKTEAPNLIRLAEQMITDPVAAETLHILVLGDCPRSEIAQRLDVQEDVITTFEELFFDVRAVRTATSCIQHSVIERACHGGRYELASKYRAAFWGGAQVARAVVDGMALVSLDEVDRISRQEQQLRLKLDAACLIPLRSERFAVRFLTASMNYDLGTKRLELAKQRFRQHCEAEIRRHEAVLERLRREARRDELRAEARRRRDQRQAQRQTMAMWRANRWLALRKSKEQQAERSGLSKLTWVDEQDGRSRTVHDQSAAGHSPAAVERGPHCPQPNVIVDGSSLTEVGSTEPADTSGSDNRFTTVGETITLKSRLPLIKWVYRPSQGHSADRDAEQERALTGTHGGQMDT